jgi:hypothetical protein
MASESRRRFLKKMITVSGTLAAGIPAESEELPRKKTLAPSCTLYRSVNGTPRDNMLMVIGLAGGPKRLFGPEDVVLIKPNVQWWNQGAPNLSALETLVDLIMNRAGGFRGEVIVAENCHRGPDPSQSKSSGWKNHFEWNSDIPNVYNMNGLTGLLKKQYGNRFSTTHWINASSGGKRVFGPSDGPGYVYCDGSSGVPLISCENEQQGSEHRATIMTYPIFVTERGTVIDFKNGVWRKGSYTGQPLRFINLSALNHHSAYCGITSSIKNYMGITDLSGGPNPHNNGRLSGNYYNFHSFPFNEWAPGPAAGMLGKEIGVFIKEIRKADLNITTAEWVGLSSRIHPPVVRTRVVLASTDPVALDYHGAKYIIYPNSRIRYHNPDNAKGPLNHYLRRCAQEYGGFFDEKKVKVHSYNFHKKRYQNDDELVIIGNKEWGNDFRSIMKYLYLRLIG